MLPVGGRAIDHPWRFVLGFARFALMALTVFTPFTAQAAEQTDINVLVQDLQTGEPINQAHLTLTFREQRRYRKDIVRSFSAKTDRNGRCVFHFIPVGMVRLIVTAENHQSFGKEFDIEKNNPVIEVKLRKPQPQV